MQHPLLPRAGTRAERRNKRIFAPSSENWKLYGSSGFAALAICVIWASQAVRLPGIPVPPMTAHLVTPVSGDAGGAKERGEETER